MGGEERVGGGLDDRDREVGGGGRERPRDGRAGVEPAGLEQRREARQGDVAAGGAEERADLGAVSAGLALRTSAATPAARAAAGLEPATAPCISSDSSTRSVAETVSTPSAGASSQVAGERSP